MSRVDQRQGTNPTEEEARKTLSRMQHIVELTENQLDLMVTNRLRFEEMKVGGLVKKNMLKSRDASQDLSKVMLEKSPPSLKEEAEKLDKRRAVGFEKANKAFAEASGGEDQADGEDDSD